MALEGLVEEEPLGYIFSEEGYYEPAEITFTVMHGERVEIGDIVCIEHPSKPGVPVFYQVVDVPVRRKARDYEEDLARAGRPLIDETRDYLRARAKQIGYVEDVERLLAGETSTDDLRMLIEHIRPLSKVYRPSETVIRNLLEPSEPSIEVGKIYPNWKHSLKLELPKLMRQGLLVVGGVGTGKTTTMLTILARTIREIKRLGGKPHILIIDKDGEYGAKELINLAGPGEYIRLGIDEIGGDEYSDKHAYAEKLRKILGYYDRRPKAAKALYQAVQEYQGEKLVLTPEFVRNEILPLIRDPKTAQELRTKITIWQSRLSKTGEPVEEEARKSISEVLELLKEKTIVHLDLSSVSDFNHAFDTLARLLKRIYNEVLRDETFGCIVAIDEAHIYAPESRGGLQIADEEHVRELKSILKLIATTGPRNGVTPFIATQRPSLIDKTITTQMGQNIIAHRVEDVDIQRMKEIMGPVAEKVRVLPRGWAIVKALAAKVREPMIVRVEKEASPTSTGKTAYHRFLPQSGGEGAG